MINYSGTGRLANFETFHLKNTFFSSYPGEFQADLDDDSDSGSDAGLTEPGADENLAEPALKYLEKCCKILSSMWKIPVCPTFSGAHRY